MSSKDKVVDIPMIGRFPSPYVSESEKLSAEYAKRYAKGVYSELTDSRLGNWAARRERIRTAKKYRYNTMERHQYAQMLAKVGGASSNINFENIGIGRRLVNEIVGKMSRLPFEISALAQDNLSKSEKQAWFDEKLYEIQYKEFIQKAQQKGVDVPTPQPEFESVEDIELFGNVKQATEIVSESVIQLVNKENNFNQIRAKIIDHLVTSGYCQTQTKIVPGYGIKHRTLDPEHCFHSFSLEENIDKEAQHIGHMYTVRADELKELVGQNNNVAHHLSTPETFNDFVASIAHEGNNPDSMVNALRMSAGEIENSKYDSYQLTVMEFEVRLKDSRVHQIGSNTHGQDRWNQKQDTWTPKSDSDKMKKEIHNIYTCKCIAGTEHILEWKKLENMTRPNSDRAEAEFTYTAYATELNGGVNTSLVYDNKEFMDGMQLAWLRIQQILTKSPPMQMGVNVNALRGIILDEGTRSATPKQLFEYFMAEGVFFHNSKDAAGNMSAGTPFEFAANDVMRSNLMAAMETFNFNRNQLLDSIGRPDTQPSAEMPVGTQQMGFESYNDSTRFILTGYRYVAERMAVKSYLQMQDIAKFHPDVVERFLGKAAVLTMEALNEMSTRDMGISFRVESDQRKRQLLEANIQTSVDRKMITPSQADTVRHIRNTRLAQRALARMEEKNAQKEMQRQMALEQEKRKTIQMQNQADVIKKQQEGEIEVTVKTTVEAARGEQARLTLEKEYLLKSGLSQEQFERDKELKGIVDESVMSRARYEQDRMDARSHQQKKDEVKAHKAKEGGVNELEYA